MRIHKVGYRFGGKQHDAYGHDNSDGHNGNVLGQSHGCDDGIQRKNNVKNGNLKEHRCHFHGVQLWLFFLKTLQAAVNFMSCFGQQKQSSSDQNDIPSGNILPQDRKPGLCKIGYPDNGKKEHQAGQHGQH